MQKIAHCGDEHSSRRQNYQQQQQVRAQRNKNNNENSSDVDGTAHRVASVTLESDSLSAADQPMSFRSKRRKRIPRREKQPQDMDVDEHQQRKQPKQSSGEGDEVVIVIASRPGDTVIPACKVQMDWEESDNLPSTSVPDGIRHSASDLEKNQSDVLSDFSESTSNADADDEQSDWPEFADSKQNRRPATAHHQHGHLLQPELTSPAGGGDAVALSSAVVKQVKQFLQSPEEKELLLDQVYRTSAIKQMLRQQTGGMTVQIVKKGRGTVALKKV